MFCLKVHTSNFFYFFRRHVYKSYLNVLIDPQKKESQFWNDKSQSKKVIFLLELSL